MHYTVHGIIQARILERVAHPFSRGSSGPRDQTQVFLIAGDCLPAEPRGRPLFPLMSFKDNSRGFSPLKVIVISFQATWVLSNLNSQLCVHVLSHVQLFATPWTVAHQAPLSMKFSRQEY